MTKYSIGYALWHRLEQINRLEAAAWRRLDCGNGTAEDVALCAAILERHGDHDKARHLREMLPTAGGKGTA